MSYFVRGSSVQTSKVFAETMNSQVTARSIVSCISRNPAGWRYSQSVVGKDICIISPSSMES